VIVKTRAALRRLVSRWRAAGETVGFVPTMGALHAGHAALVRRAAAENERVIVSVFVNPTQFGPGEDYSRYPRSLPADRRLVAAAGGHAVYAPSSAEMYPEGFRTHVEVEGWGALYCGRYRPGHFRGVATVVLKLLNQVGPDRAYFGEKDYQQLSILRRMVKDLDVPVSIVGVPTIREDNGLAMSSRNAYLNDAERAAAPALHAAMLASSREKDPAAALRRRLRGTALKLQYAAVAREFSGGARFLAAAFLGRTRLIDNVALEKRR
jgi:pantoate--beta-alanine ligase